MEWAGLYSEKYEDYVASELRRLGYSVLQNIYITIEGKGEVQIDILAFDFTNNVMYVIEVKSWDSRAWMSGDLGSKNWSYATQGGSIYNRFNPHMQCQFHVEYIETAIKALIGNGIVCNARVIFKYKKPLWSRSLATSAEEGFKLENGKSSFRSVKAVYDAFKDEEDFSEERRIAHVNYLVTAKEERTGGYGKTWGEKYLLYKNWMLKK